MAAAEPSPLVALLDLGLADPGGLEIVPELAAHGRAVFVLIARDATDVWGPAHRQDLDYLRVAVRALRRKLERDPAHPKLIINEPGIGYRIAVS
ncbi:transcriptional regulator [Blastomonas natatoria]|uniref:Transcriptional regulator n=1 Tax=Blastomonas natatoria TaxID=34015 RepID=A0A2V3VAA4_9SPHN|nr:transcriptional regulator [Blastomonas natatoria]